MSIARGFNGLNIFTHADFYESMDSFVPNEEDYLKFVVSELSETWTVDRVNAIWFGLRPPSLLGRLVPLQGWKIHISSTVAHSDGVIRAVVPILGNRNIGFKFALDRTILGLMNSKSWVRQGAGKFITIYPHNEGEFCEAIDALHQETRQFEGPFILSDRRYRDSKVLFYRYGGILPNSRLLVTGFKEPILVSPDGNAVSDERRPYFWHPDWTTDPVFRRSFNDSQPETVALKDGRYSVKSAIRYSNAGGIYFALDNETHREVIIKEARPYVEATLNSTALLSKEYRLLSKLAHTGIAPQPVDFFLDWEHSFLVQDYIPASSLSDFNARTNVVLHTHPTIETARAYYSQFVSIVSQIVDIIEILHANNIVFSDLSPSNLLIHSDLKIKIIDFEGAYEIGYDAPIQLFTPGFAYADQMSGQAATFESDYFSLGAIMHFLLFPVNDMFLVNPRSRNKFIDSVVRDIGFPTSIATVTKKLLGKSSEDRPRPTEVRTYLFAGEEIREPAFAIDTPGDIGDYPGDVRKMLSYILAHASYERKDRLFPSSGLLFQTNPLSVAYGACGIAYVLNRISGVVPQAVMDWILSKKFNQQAYPPGLYLGLSGISWTMIDLGLEAEARRIMHSASTHPLLHESPDLFYGVAGWGMANLHLFLKLQDEQFLTAAQRAGQHLISSAVNSEAGIYWPTGSDVKIGYGHGASGIALFLLYLHLASGEDRFLDFGIRALDFDISTAVPNLDKDGLSWKESVNKVSIMYPYLMIGSAGVGMAILRYFRLTGNTRYRELLDKIYLDTSRKYAVFPTFFKGLAGKGEFLMDLYSYTNQTKYLDAVYKVSAGISLFKIQKSEGLAFPGEMLRRISCDYGTGSAGIAHFMARVINPRKGSAFILDELFDKSNPMRGNY